MSSSKTEVMMWAQRVLSRKNGPAHLVLEVKEHATPDESQAAFHKIARAAHPDLHRHSLSADELETVTSAYAAVAGAYMQMRSQRMSTQRMQPIKPYDGGGKPDAATTAPDRPTPIPAGTGRTPPAGAPAAPPPSEAPTSVSPQAAAQAMSAKAITYYRKAETALKRGDLKGALLQIKLAIAVDPTSSFLRNALAEVDAELRRGP